MIKSCSTCCIQEREPEAVAPMLQYIDADYFELFLFNHWEKEKKEEIPHIFAGYQFFSVHGSKKVGFLLEEDTEKGMALLREDILVAYKVEASTVVFHIYNSLNEKPDLGKVVGILESVRGYAEEYSVSLSLELIPHIAVPIPEIARFFDIHLDKNIFFVMDLEYTSKYQCLDEVLHFVSRISNIHVRDYDGQWILNGKRRYLKPLDGTSDFGEIFSIIAKAKYSGTYTLEAPHRNVEEINSSMRWLTFSLRTHNSL